MTQRLSGYVGSACCLLYAVCWVVVWWTPETLPPMVRAIEPIASGRSHMKISALMAGALLFGASPLVREDRRRVVRVFHAIAIFALISPGLWPLVAPWLRAQTVPISIMEAIVWLLVPLIIAIWALIGSDHSIWPKTRFSR